MDVEVIPGGVTEEGIEHFERIGEDVTERLERKPSCMVVVRITKPKFVRKSDRKGDGPVTVHQAATPDLPIEGAAAGPGMLADTLVKRWDDHLPLHRLQRIYAREEIEMAKADRTSKSPIPPFQPPTPRLRTLPRPQLLPRASAQLQSREFTPELRFKRLHPTPADARVHRQRSSGGEVELKLSQRRRWGSRTRGGAKDGLNFARFGSDGLHTHGALAVRTRHDVDGEDTA